MVTQEEQDGHRVSEPRGAKVFFGLSEREGEMFEQSRLSATWCPDNHQMTIRKRGRGKILQMECSPC